jgi:serine/threonine protein kinase
MLKSFSSKEIIISRLFLQMINAMQYCHEQNIIHRNLRPENIILTSNNQIKIFNFEIDSDLTQILDLNYKSPEVILGNKYSFQSDV